MQKPSNSWLNNLNQPQKHAVMHEKNGPLLVVAGAGSGKTRTLAYRVAYLISKGVAPEKILLLTFTRRAAREMLRRAADVSADKGKLINRVWGGTFHATANRLLRIYHKSAGLPAEFTIIDQADAEDLIDVIRQKNKFSQLDKRFPKKRTCLAIYSKRLNTNQKLDKIIKDDFPWCDNWINELKILFKDYVSYKEKICTLDYDDLLLYWYYLLDDQEIARSIENRFDHILVDEYQDTNRIQAEILKKMRIINQNIMAVGDDAQSIYSFRSASVRNMLDFADFFPNPEIITLEENYRSTDHILETTNRVIAQARERYSKTLYTKREPGQKPQLITCIDEHHENDNIIEKILNHLEQGIPLHNQAVLFRASSHSMSLELALMQKNIPFHKFGGLKFIEAAHIKDLINIVRIIENARDEMAWFRILKLFDAIGPAIASRIYNHLAENNFDLLSINQVKIPAGANHHISSFLTMYEDIMAMKEATFSIELERIIKFYLPILEKNYENSQPRKDDIKHLGALSGQYPNRTKFLVEIILDPPVSTSDLAGPAKKEEDHLILSTIHSAKGCEWDAVYLMHTVDGCLPSDMATGNQESIEEELRLAYVAMTRAKNYLYVTWPLKYYNPNRRLSDTHVYAQCSRFFSPDVQKTMDYLAIPEENNAEDETVNEVPAQDIRKRIQDFWD